MANAFGLQIALHTNKIVWNLMAGLAEFIDPLLDESESCTRIVDLFDLGVQVGDFALHLLRHVP